jgi:hypothetical protein
MWVVARAGSPGVWRVTADKLSGSTAMSRHWHTRAEIDNVLRHLPVCNLQHRYGVFIPSGSQVARALERSLPVGLPLGSFVAVAGDIGR